VRAIATTGNVAKAAPLRLDWRPFQRDSASMVVDGRIIAARVMSEEVGSASRGEEPMAKRKTEEESLAQRKPDAPQLPKVEIDFETLVVGGIAAVITKSPKKRRNPRSNPAR